MYCGMRNGTADANTWVREMLNTFSGAIEHVDRT